MNAVVGRKRAVGKARGQTRAEVERGYEAGKRESSAGAGSSLCATVVRERERVARYPRRYGLTREVEVEDR